ncbi:MAG: glycerol-3-phosphate dehydrogenase, partial [Gammaproteobacteria bacterium]
MERLQKERSNVQYLPGVPFPDNLHVCDSLARFPQQTRRYLVVVPSHAFRTIMSLLKIDVKISPDSTVVWATKGLEPGSARLLSTVAAEELGESMKTAVISGPTFAGEVARDLPTALTVASESDPVAEDVATWFRGNRVRAYTNPDIVGVQIGGALKN